MEEVEHLCNRVAIIDGGRIIAMDTIKNLVNMLGGGVIYIGVPRVDEDLLQHMASLPAVQEATLVPREPAPPPAPGQEAKAETQPAVGERIKIVAQHSQEAVLNVINFLNARDIDLTSLDILEPNLESVFLHLTGKKLRE
jgi:ABC-2 type transport system ATP-binding protein